MSDKEPLSADDNVNVTDWAQDLTYREVHLFTEGVFRGLTRLDPRPGKELQGKVLADSWYYKGGFVIGYLISLVVVVAAGITGMEAL
jgi:hypothetical protein